MQFQLLIELDALDFVQSLPRSRRTALFAHFRDLRAHPERHSDYVEHDERGRRVEVSVLEGLAIYYWIDYADRHVKILRLVVADI